MEQVAVRYRRHCSSLVVIARHGALFVVLAYGQNVLLHHGVQCVSSDGWCPCLKQRWVANIRLLLWFVSIATLRLFPYRSYFIIESVPVRVKHCPRITRVQTQIIWISQLLVLESRKNHRLQCCHHVVVISMSISAEFILLHSYIFRYHLSNFTATFDQTFLSEFNSKLASNSIWKTITYIEPVNHSG